MAWRRISPLLALATAVAIVLIAAIVLVPLAISPQRIRAHVAYEVRAMTGSELSLQEPPTLSYFPSFKATFNDVALTRPGGPKGPPPITAEQAQVELSLWSALTGRVNVVAIRLVRPHFVLDAKGSAPSLLLQDALASPGSVIASMMAETRAVIEAAPSNPDASKLPSIRFGRVTIEDGLLTFRRGSGTEQISSINGVITWPRSDSAISLKAAAIWHGEAADVEASSSRPLFLFAGGTAPIKLSVTSTPLNLSLDGNANLSNNLFVSGKLSLSSPSLKRMLEWSRTKIDPGAAIGSVAVDANMTLAQDRVKLDNVALTLDDNPGKGVLEIGTDNGMPKISGTLAFGTLDLKSFLSAFTAAPDGQTPPGEIDTKFLNQIGLDVRFSADTAKAGPLTLSKVAATMQVSGGQASFDIGDSTAFGGTLQASFHLARSGDDNVGELRLNGTDIDSSAVATLFGIKRQFPLGHMSGSAVLKGPITTWSSAADRGDGTIQLHFDAGQIKGFNLPEFIKRAKSNGFFSIDDMKDATLAFDAVDVKAKIADGVATLGSATVKTKQDIITLNGIVPFVGRSLALSGHLKMPPPAQSSDNKAVDPSDIYFFVGGSWDRPFVSPVLLGPPVSVRP